MAKMLHNVRSTMPCLKEKIVDKTSWILQSKCLSSVFVCVFVCVSASSYAIYDHLGLIWCKTRAYQNVVVNLYVNETVETLK